MADVIRVATLATTIEFGGIERVLLNLFQHMGAGVEFFPVLFTRDDRTDNGFFDCLDALGLPHERVSVNRSTLKYLNPLRNVRDACGIFRRRRFDLVHSHGYRADFIASIVARRFGLPLVSTCHGFIAADRHVSFYNRLDLFLLRHVTRVIAVSARMKEDLVARGIDPAKIHVITNAVAEPAAAQSGRNRRRIRTRLGLRGGDFVFGFAGRLSDEKGVEDLLRAAGRLALENGACRILLLGDGPRRAALERTAQELGLSDRVHFAGFQRNASEWYTAMDAFVLPSLTEGTPMALLEAMAHRLPVIATAVGGVPAILQDRKNGILVPAANPAKLLEAMRAVMAGPELRNTLSANAARSIREAYDVGAWSRQMRDVYRSMVEPCPAS